jgi:dephospho-CoA kinase
MTKIIGLTGGIGSGKSTVAKYIASKGIPVYIADEEARKIMTNEKVIAEIQTIFSESVLTNEDKLDRVKIANIVFNNPDKLKELNAVVHPKVKKHFVNWLKRHKNDPFIVKEVAILFETGGDKECDAVILVTAPEEIRIQRTTVRDNSTVDNVKKRMNNQLPDAEKVKKSTFVINNINFEETYFQVDEILKMLNNS